MKNKSNKDIVIKEGAIYMFTNLVNGKRYIGQTTRIYGNNNRYYLHINKSKHPNAIKNCLTIDYAIYKYGIENFKYEILFYMRPCNYDSLKIILDSLELFYIRKYLTLVTENGYNILKGGHSAYIHKRGKRKISNWNKGKKGCFSKETLLIMSLKKKGHIPWNKGKKNCYTKELLDIYKYYADLGRPKCIAACEKAINVYKDNILVRQYKSRNECALQMKSIMSLSTIKRLLLGKTLKNFPEYKIIYKENDKQ